MMQWAPSTQPVQLGGRLDWFSELPPAHPGAGSSGSREERSSFSDGKPEPMRVLVVDDEKLIADTLARILNLSGFAAHAVYSGEAAIAALDTHCPDIVLTDVRMPGRNGIETAVSIRAQCPHIRVVLFSGQAGVSELMEQAKRDGHGFELWSKPLHPRELVKRLQAL